MSEAGPLWTSDAIAAATRGTASAAFVAEGVAFDSREVGPGDLFVALKGAEADGHDYVGRAFAAGAAGAVVSRAVDGPHILVDDTTDALVALARRARERTAARIVGVTGSVGKTGVKEALFHALDRQSFGAAHRSVKSYNNHVGVPLSLARMPAASRYGVFEMGMNHSGELAVLTRLVRPHVALVTAIAPAHIGHFDGEEAIADAKAEIFEGLGAGGTAIVPADSPHCARLYNKAVRHAERVVTFGFSEKADVRVLDHVPASDGGTMVNAALVNGRVSFHIAHPGLHWVSNALAVMAAVEALGGDCGQAGLALAELPGMPGRGARVRVTVDGHGILIIDESYNANPASMAATLAQLGEERGGRRIAVLGAMKELGAQSDALHAGLAAPVAAAGLDRLILVGQETAPLADAVRDIVSVQRVDDAAGASEALREDLREGDIILVKGSNSLGLSRLVAAMTEGEG